jgi:hypothetical protein
VEWRLSNGHDLHTHMKKPCCEKEENLESKQDRPDLVIKTCKVCGCRHFELSVDPIRMGIKGASL